LADQRGQRRLGNRPQLVVVEGQQPQLIQPTEEAGPEAPEPIAVQQQHLEGGEAVEEAVRQVGEVVGEQHSIGDWNEV